MGWSSISCHLLNMLNGSTNGCFWLLHPGTSDLNNINADLYFNSVAVPPPPTAILDSGATATFVTTADSHHLLDTTDVVDGPRILAANGIPMPTTQRGRLFLSTALSPAAQPDRKSVV